jgi:hypothetical protein
MKHHNIPEPALTPSLIANSAFFDYRDLTWGCLSLQLEVASGFVPVLCFSVYPPLTI